MEQAPVNVLVALVGLVRAHSRNMLQQGAWWSTARKLGEIPQLNGDPPPRTLLQL